MKGLAMLTSDERERLIAAAKEARQWAYAPYSNYAVGAALLSKSGRTYEGVNIENAVFPMTICAERVAVFKAVSEGEFDFEAIAVVTRNGGSPCGACRQVLAEFGMDTVVLIADETGQLVSELTVRDLLPGAFGSQDLSAQAQNRG
jgi:cytidine deaminase